jgi:hypothetical protein
VSPLRALATLSSYWGPDGIVAKSSLSASALSAALAAVAEERRRWAKEFEAPEEKDVTAQAVVSELVARVRTAANAGAEPAEALRAVQNLENALREYAGLMAEPGALAQDVLRLVEELAVGHAPRVALLAADMLVLLKRASLALLKDAPCEPLLELACCNVALTTSPLFGKRLLTLASLNSTAARVDAFSALVATDGAGPDDLRALIFVLKEWSTTDRRSAAVSADALLSLWRDVFRAVLAVGDEAVRAELVVEALAGPATALLAADDVRWLREQLAAAGTPELDTVADMAALLCAQSPAKASASAAGRIVARGPAAATQAACLSVIGGGQLHVAFDTPLEARLVRVILSLDRCVSRAEGDLSTLLVHVPVLPRYAPVRAAAVAGVLGGSVSEGLLCGALPRSLQRVDAASFATDADAVFPWTLDGALCSLLAKKRSTAAVRLLFCALRTAEVARDAEYGLRLLLRRLETALAEGPADSAARALLEAAVQHLKE